VRSPLRSATYARRRDEPFVRVSLELDNRQPDHRLRVLVPADTSGGAWAGTAFGAVQRPFRRPGTDSGLEFDLPTDPARLWVDSGGVAVFLTGPFEYELVEGAIAITLLRSVGWLSRGDMPERRGHAGPALETPSAQGIGTRTYRYCVVALAGEMTLARAGREVREFLSPARTVRGTAPIGPLLELPRDSAVQVSALRAGPEGSLVLRLFNPRTSEESVTVRFASAVAEARAVDLREGDLGLGNTGFDVIRTAQPPVIEDGAMTVRLLAYEIGTYLVRLTGA
jgi:alpha-mannosidase